MSATLVEPSAWNWITIPRPPLSAVAGLLFLLPWEAATYLSGKASFYRSWHPLLQGMLTGALLILLAMGLSNNVGTFIYFQF